MDVIFTIVSRNYAALAATLMESVAKAEPNARRVVVATDGPIPSLSGTAEVIEAPDLDAPFAEMTVYYEALELNTAVKPYAFLRFMAEGARSVTYLDPDIYVFRPMGPVREALEDHQLVLTPHLTRPLLGEASPNDLNILRSGSYNLGYATFRNDPRPVDLLRWWADRCRFDCRVDLEGGLFTDQRWMDLAPGFVDSLAVIRSPALNLAYWNLESRMLERAADGWRVDGEPLVFFHFSGFDPAKPRVLSKHQNRLSVAAASPLAELLAEYAGHLLRNGHAESSKIPYAYNRFPSGRAVTRSMRRRALRAARAGEGLPGGLDETTSDWLDAVEPDAVRPGLPDITRLMDQAWRDTPAADPFDRETVDGRLGFHRWFADNAEALGADDEAVRAAARLAQSGHDSAREADPGAWRERPWTGPAHEALAWLRDPVEGPVPRACRALLAARRDLRRRFKADPGGLLAWCIGPEALADRFAIDLLPDHMVAALAGDRHILFEAARFADAAPSNTDLRRRLNVGFGVGERAGWPAALTESLRAPYLAPAASLPAPFVRLFLDIWESRPDVQRLYPLHTAVGRLRYLRWLLGGGLAEYGVELSALPDHVRRTPLMRLAAYSVRSKASPRALRGEAKRLLVVESAQGETAAEEGVVLYEASTGRFLSAGAPAPAPSKVELVCFLTAPAFTPADAIALHAHGLEWARAVGVWDVRGLEADEPGLGFVDEIWTAAGAATPSLPRPVRPLEDSDPLRALSRPALAA